MERGTAIAVMVSIATLTGLAGLPGQALATQDDCEVSRQEFIPDPGPWWSGARGDPVSVDGYEVSDSECIVQNRPGVPDPESLEATGDAADKVAAGGAHSCALLSSRDVHCWGYNSFGQSLDYTGGDATDIAAGGRQAWP